MVKTPRTRHSKSSREPVTIDLESDQVSRVEKADTAAPTPETVPSTPEPSVKAEEAVRAAAEAKPAVPPVRDHARDYSFTEKPAPKPDEKPAAETAKDTEKPAEKAAPAQPAPQAEPARRGGIGLLAAGLVGGVVALAGAGALQFAGVLGAPGGYASTDSSGLIAELQAQVADLAASRSDDGSAQRIESLSTGLDQVKGELASLKSAVEASAGNGDNGEALAALSQKVGELETSVAALGEAARPEAVDLGPVNERLAALEEQVRAAGDGVEQQASRLAVLDQSLADVTGKVEEQAGQPKIALAIAASALKSALERGAPFKAELETFAAIAPEAPQLAGLRSYAEQGVATRTEIAAQVDAAADAMVAADDPVDDNAGFVQRLMSSAEKLVKVRPIGAVEGPGVPETVARLEAAVTQGDYGKALAEYEALPAPVQAAGADFAAALRAHMEAEAQVDALVAETMAGGEG
ncbi:phage tail protein [Aquamicrobium lusatiense]|uniref:phage tail protein n=1 Tax=Aquamicrobium lusatiense TaxID=89772 RepID=UPI002458C34D|nr:phage tail protein [Aquamicrobium lusatiense]MDH4991438.1 phage tail protein [Aquamicrobium lusatiense]